VSAQDDDAAAKIRGGKPRTLAYRVCVDPDLVGEYERAVAERDEVKAAPRTTMAAAGVPAELEERIAALLEQIEADTIVLTFKALPRPEFGALRDQYPPKRNADGAIERHYDARLGVDTEGFFEPLIRASLISPVLDEETLTVLIEERLTDGQWDDLTTKVWNLNQATVSVPFSPAVSPTTPSSSPRSRRRNGSAAR